MPGGECRGVGVGSTGSGRKAGPGRGPARGGSRSARFRTKAGGGMPAARRRRAGAAGIARRGCRGVAGHGGAARAVFGQSRRGGEGNPAGGHPAAGCRPARRCGCPAGRRDGRIAAMELGRTWAAPLRPPEKPAIYRIYFLFLSSRFARSARRDGDGLRGEVHRAPLAPAGRGAPAAQDRRPRPGADLRAGLPEVSEPAAHGRALAGRILGMRPWPAAPRARSPPRRPRQAARSRISAKRSDLPSKPMPGSSGMVMWPASTRTPSGKPP